MGEASQEIGEAAGAPTRFSDGSLREINCLVQIDFEKLASSAGPVGRQVVMQDRLGAMTIDRFTPPGDLEGSRDSGRTGNLRGSLFRIASRSTDLEMGLLERGILKDVDISGIHRRKGERER